MAANDLKDVVCENLVRSLSPDKGLRECAEQQLNMLETNEEYGICLIEITLTENLDFSVRHLASVLLSQYIVKHWSKNGAKYQPPEINPVWKVLIREYLLKSLNISTNDENNNTDTATRKLLSSYAHSISQIAQFDWPQEWPDLLPVLMGYLESGTPRIACSALKVFGELAHEISDSQIPDLAPLLLPNMLTILQSPNFSTRSKSNAVKIFTALSETIIFMKDYHTAAIETYLAPFIDRFADIAIALLMIPNNCSDMINIGLKKDIIHALAIFIRECRKYMKVHLQKIMQLVWENLTNSASMYVRQIVNSTSDGGDENHDLLNDSLDPDGEPIGFDSYVYSILDFVNAILESPKYRDLIKPVLAELIYFILFYIQITDEQIEVWQANIDQFVEEDDLDSISYSVRIAAQDLILFMAREMTSVDQKPTKKDDELFKLAFLQAINRHFAEAKELENQGKSWWKIAETCLYSLGVLAPTIIYTVNSENHQLAQEYKAILDTVVSNFTLNEPFLSGRSIWTASRFSQIMNDQSLDNFLKLTGSLLTMTDKHPVLRIYALRSTYYFCTNAKNNLKVQVMKPYLNQYLEGLVTIGIHGNSDLFYLALETIETLLKLDREFTISVNHSVCQLCISAFLQYPEDPVIFGIIQEIFSELFSIAQCARDLQQQLLPVIVSIMNGHMKEVFSSAVSGGYAKEELLKSITAQQLQPLAVDLLSDMIRYSPFPPSETMIQQAYPALLRCLQSASSDDSSILQNSTECIRNFVAKGSQELSNFVDPSNNQNGITLAVNVCNNLLHPQVPESCSAYVGQLVCTLIIKANQAISQETFHFLLKSTLVKLNTCKQTLITEGLILVFAHLTYLDLTNTLVFLNSIPAPLGTGSALEFVLNRWLAIQRFFSGYDNKACTLALCKLFQFSLRSNPNSPIDDCELRINLHQIQVHQEDLGDDEGNIASRTRAKVEERDHDNVNFTPCTVKLLKSLINELRHIDEFKQSAKQEDSEEEDSDEEDSFGAVDGSDKEVNLRICSSDLLSDSLFEDEADTILSEEIASFDLEEVLCGVLKEFTISPFAEQLFKYLTESEKNCLKKVASQ